MRREKATHTEDLPHRFEDHDGACTVCQGSRADERHVAWERERAAEEHPPARFERELGA